MASLKATFITPHRTPSFLAYLGKSYGYMLWAIILACGVDFTGHAQATSSLHIHVVDSEGAVVKSLIFIHATAKYNWDDPTDNSLPADQKVSTDSVGTVAVQVKPKTFYNICAFAPGFSAECTTLLIEQGKEKDIRISMKFDEFLCQYFCDTFPVTSPKNKPRH